MTADRISEVNSEIYQDIFSAHIRLQNGQDGDSECTPSYVSVTEDKTEGRKTQKQAVIEGG